MNREEQTFWAIEANLCLINQRLQWIGFYFLLLLFHLVNLHHSFHYLSFFSGIYFYVKWWTWIKALNCLKYLNKCIYGRIMCENLMDFGWIRRFFFTFSLIFIFRVKKLYEVHPKWTKNSSVMQIWTEKLLFFRYKPRSNVDDPCMDEWCKKFWHANGRNLRTILKVFFQYILDDFI